MLNSICNKKGITLIEVMVSLVLITVGVLSLLSLLPAGIRQMTVPRYQEQTRL